MSATTTSEPTQANFLSLPGEIRNRVYELVLIDDELIDIPLVSLQNRTLTPGLLRASKVIHLEGCSVLYGRNRFDFTDYTPKRMTSLVEEIGRDNFGYIQHVEIAFPKFAYLDPGDVALEDDSISILETIQIGCPGLSTLTTSLYSTNSMEIKLDDLEHHKVAIEALRLVDAQFKAISSTTQIILEVFEDGPSQHARKRMEGHGWTFKKIEYEEEEEDLDRDLEDFGSSYYDFDGGYDNDYYYDHDSGDEYDIDNDSDFWRRAAD